MGTVTLKLICSVQLIFILSFATTKSTKEILCNSSSQFNVNCQATSEFDCDICGNKHCRQGYKFNDENECTLDHQSIDESENIKGNLTVNETLIDNWNITSKNETSAAVDVTKEPWFIAVMSILALAVLGGYIVCGVCYYMKKRPLEGSYDVRKATLRAGLPWS